MRSWGASAIVSVVLMIVINTSELPCMKVAALSSPFLLITNGCAEAGARALSKCGGGDLLRTASKDGSADKSLIECCDAMLKETSFGGPDCWCVNREFPTGAELVHLAVDLFENDYLKEEKFAKTSCGILRNFDCSEVIEESAKRIGSCHVEARKAVDVCKPIKKVIEKGSTGFFGLGASESGSKMLSSCCETLKPISDNLCLCKILAGQERSNVITKEILRFATDNKNKICNNFRIDETSCVPI